MKKAKYVYNMLNDITYILTYTILFCKSYLFDKCVININDKNEHVDRKNDIIAYVFLYC